MEDMTVPAQPLFNTTGTIFTNTSAMFTIRSTLTLVLLKWDLGDVLPSLPIEGSGMRRYCEGFMLTHLPPKVIGILLYFFWEHWVINDLPHQCPLKIQVGWCPVMTPNKPPLNKERIDLGDCQQETKLSNRPPLCSPTVLNTGKGMVQIIRIIYCMQYLRWMWKDLV